MTDRLDIQQVLDQSELIRLVRALQPQHPHSSRLFGDNIKPLSAEQIARLRTQGCDASNWSNIHVTEGFDARTVSETHFEGRCVLGALSETHRLASGVRFPSGIHNATLIECEVGNNVLIRDVSLLANYVIGHGAVVCGVNEMIAAANATFGNGTEIALGIETGERAIRAYAELDFSLANRLARAAPGSELRRAYDELLGRYLEAIALRKGYVGPGASIRVCRRLSDVFIGEAAVIEGATAIVNATILSNREEPARIGDGALVRNSLIQWGCEVTTGAIVESSVLTEHSHVERHGKVTHSLLGPNTGVGEGEVTSALLGPFVGFHHQSLLIAALWPEGKGNVGYGANVGSNHTSKAPDQEIWPGEGMFFGLGVNIKFPSNFERSAYTIIATGVTTLPQRVEFPFSLINAPSQTIEGVSPAYNEIIPAWVLSDNAYALARNEAKFRDRNRARRTRVAFEVFRPETVDLIKEARRRLQNAPQKSAVQPGGRILYFEKDIPGLGKNYMFEASRIEAVETYSSYLRFYALRGLYRRLIASEIGDIQFSDPETILTQPAETVEWAHQLQTLNEELPNRSVRDLLGLWVEHHQKYVESVRLSKARDDERGSRIIPDYGAIHTGVDNDKLVRRLVTDHEEIKKRVETWLNG